MADEQQAMYDGFSDTYKHSTEWVRITKEFLKLAFLVGCSEASCLWSRCEDRMILSMYEMSTQLAKKWFMSNYLVWHQHGEVQPLVADEWDGNNNEDRMDDMVADIGRRYDLESRYPLPEVQNFYRLLGTSEEKVHDGTNVTVL
jgi:hypothetical protein